MDEKLSEHAGHSNAPDASSRHPPSCPMTPSGSDHSHQEHVDETLSETQESLSNVQEDASSRGLSNSSLTPASPEQAASQARTSERRKEEIEALRDQVTALEATLSLLQNSIGVTDGTSSLDQQAINNALLQETLQNQQLLAARLRSMTAAAERKLQDARHFIANRTQFMSSSKQFSESKRHRTIDGGTSITKLTIHRLGDASSVKQVYDLILQMEREATDDVIVREDVDTGDEETKLHHTIRVSNAHGVEVEEHRVLFAESAPRDIHLRANNAASIAGERCADGALITIDFVDQDDVYPYTPSQRLREDVTSVIVVHVNQSAGAQRNDDQHQGSHEATGSVTARQEPPQSGIVMTRWVRVTLHHTELTIPEELCEQHSARRQ
ncbi:hypothetical protein FI667_g9602, partial [Globisporangium splendens]